ncbi:hypothetical protein [Geminocystis sp. NIES-3709]|uniref:hypothetical protein n=1 Tax=Geminocystis sp. NIES-3709 TaxID=1617448 RepID=UPI0005FCBC0E|nr:hypothetical protein [Geminocystis sp. NIES-3709]BAQ65419.1 hypothetical protein GM3709_2184 [Geminocystis sp. NIES-3709]
MLHHLSIGVKNPSHVAQVLAKIVQGQAFPFPVFPNSYIVIVGDEYGTAIEIQPLGLELIPGETEVISQTNSSPSGFSSTHAAMTVPSSQVEIEAIAENEGWLHRYCDRGPFDLIEVWVENHFMFEFIPPEMSSRYTDFMSIEKYLSFLNAGQPQPH